MDNIELHEYWMRQAIELADQSQLQPFAAIIVDDETQQVLSTGGQQFCDSSDLTW